MSQGRPCDRLFAPVVWNIPHVLLGLSPCILAADTDILKQVIVECKQLPALARDCDHVVQAGPEWQALCGRCSTDNLLVDGNGHNIPFRDEFAVSYLDA